MKIPSIFKVLLETIQEGISFLTKIVNPLPNSFWSLWEGVGKPGILNSPSGNDLSPVKSLI